MVGLGLFGLLRLPWVEAHMVLPVTRFQGDLAAAAFQTPAAPISVTLACSGTEVIALCLGAVLAYPVSWRSRVSGAVLIVLGILALNTARIGTLGLAAGDPQWFDALHLYLWPAGLILATSGAVFAWMRHADGAPVGTWAPSWRFVALACVLLAVSALTAPAYIDSAAVFQIGSLIAHTGAATLAAVGAATSATGNVLWTLRGGFSVTGDCVATPLLPLYLAAIWTYAASWPRRWLGLVLAAPIFFVLGVVRLLLVALPHTVAPVPEFASHAFYQVVLGCVLIGLAARWRHGRRAWVIPASSGIAAAVAIMVVIGDLYAGVVMGPVARPLVDPQGALAFLPPFQLALFVAVWLAAGRGVPPSRIGVGVLLLLASQAALVGALNVPGVPALLAGQVAVVRAWAVAGPALAWALVARYSSVHGVRDCVQNSTVSLRSPPVA